MNVALISSSISRLGGGLFTSVRRLGQELQNGSANVSVSVLSTTDRFANEDLAVWDPLKVRAHSAIGPWGFRYSPGIGADLHDLDFDIVHVQHLWMYPSVAALKWHASTKRPYVVSPRGMIDEWAVRRARLKKWVAWHAFERRHLSRARCIHALGESEIRGIRLHGIKTPICVIPNGVDLPLPQDSTPRDDGPKRRLLYLGRLHPKKGLSDLLIAWRDWNRGDGRSASEWELALAGFGEVDHVDGFRRQVRELGIEDSVRILGPSYGREKESLFRGASGFVLPSHSEGLPMAVLEAWSHGLPALITPQCNLGRGVEKGAAVSIQPTSESIMEGLAVLARMNPEERRQMGARGRQLVAAEYTWASVAGQMRAVYEWSIGGGQRPASVVD